MPLSNEKSVQIPILLGMAVLAAFMQFLLQDDILRPADPIHSNVRWVGQKEADNLDQALWVDARARGLYERGHRDGAILLNLDEWDTLLPLFLDVWEPGIHLVVYCEPGTCGSSLAVAEQLAEALPQEVIYVLKDGWTPGSKSPP